MEGRTSCAVADDRDVIQIRNALDNSRTNDSLKGVEKDDGMRKLAFIFGLLATPLGAHELWVEPEAYVIEPNVNITANIVNGQEFEGTRLPFVPRRFTYFVNFSGSTGTKVDSRLGDNPAMSQPAIAEGLNVIAYQAKIAEITYETWEKFQRFLDHKDLGDQRAIHEERGFPTEGFKEIYSRYSKSLVAVGNAAGADRQLGLLTEIVALTNPYVDDMADGMRVQLFYQTQPRADEQIEVFEKANDDTVTIFTLRTDADGIATIPVKADHEYMLDAVLLREPSEAIAADTGAAWETLWANMTFMVP